VTHDTNAKLNTRAQGHTNKLHPRTHSHTKTHTLDHTPVVTCVFVRILVLAARFFFIENSRFIKVCTHTAISDHKSIRLCNKTLSISRPRRASQGVMSHKLMSHVTHVDGLCHGTTHCNTLQHTPRCHCRKQIPSLPRHEESDETPCMCVCVCVRDDSLMWDMTHL